MNKRNDNDGFLWAAVAIMFLDMFLIYLNEYINLDLYTINGRDL